ncbi:hypothetical protein B0T16DRAFT_388801 [Cercophora newfieldiana]|uniref:Uncharacterized protein n=1 Tax=Cercophora newfieldiana TaxID=92897 RepID=A0AA40CRI7_9PEZI|nr:hypothetical protein B0T16DRAFT_388801 [Cercophora newfieldiana]
MPLRMYSAREVLEIYHQHKPWQGPINLAKFHTFFLAEFLSQETELKNEETSRRGVVNKMDSAKADDPRVDSGASPNPEDILKNGPETPVVFNSEELVNWLRDHFQVPVEVFQDGSNLVIYAESAVTARHTPNRPVTAPANNQRVDTLRIPSETSDARIDGDIRPRFSIRRSLRRVFPSGEYRSRRRSPSP